MAILKVDTPVQDWSLRFGISLELESWRLDLLPSLVSLLRRLCRIEVYTPGLSLGLSPNTIEKLFAFLALFGYSQINASAADCWCRESFIAELILRDDSEFAG